MVISHFQMYPSSDAMKSYSFIAFSYYIFHPDRISMFIIKLLPFLFQLHAPAFPSVVSPRELQHCCWTWAPLLYSRQGIVLGINCTRLCRQLTSRSFESCHAIISYEILQNGIPVPFSTFLYSSSRDPAMFLPVPTLLK